MTDATTDGSELPADEPRSWPLATILTASFGSLILAAAGFVLVLAFTGGTEAARELTAGHAAQIVATVSRQVRSHLTAARHHGEFMGKRLVARGWLLDGQEDALSEALADSLAAAPQLTGTAFVHPDLEATIVMRTERGLVAENRQVGDTEEGAAAMHEIARSTGGYWASPVYIQAIDQAAVNYRVPIRIAEDFLGGLFTTIGTDDLNRFVTEVARPHDAHAFVLVGPDEVLAYSGSNFRNLPRSAEQPLPRLADVSDPVVRDLWDGARSTRLKAPPELPGFEFSLVSASDGHEYIAVYEHLEGLGPIPWVVGCYFRVEQLSAAFERVQTGLLAGLAMLAVALLGVFFTGRQFLAPYSRAGRRHGARRSGRPIGSARAARQPASRDRAGHARLQRHGARPAGP